MLFCKIWLRRVPKVKGRSIIPYITDAEGPLIQAILFTTRASVFADKK